MSEEQSANRPTEMRARGEAIEKAEFDVPGKASPGASDASAESINSVGVKSSQTKWWHSQFNLMLATFALLGFAAMMFVVLAPPPELAVAKPANTGQVKKLSDAEAPWNKSQLTQARSDAQAILENLLDSKKKLETMEVLSWAQDRYQAALDMAAAGDELYKTQQFEEAMKSYQSAVISMDSLFDLLPELVSRKIADANLAIQQGKSALATTLFEKVLELDAANIIAAEGLQRAGKLDKVLDLINTANLSEAEFDQSKRIEALLEAQAKLEEAKTLDDKFAVIDESLARVSNKIVDRKFGLAMSKAYQALFSNKYNIARASFAEALKIKPGDGSAMRAQQQALASNSNASLRSLLANAASYEQSEQWSSASNSYAAALQRDPNQISAKMGSLRSGIREKLDTQLNDLLADPLTFGRVDRKAIATGVLTDAKAISNQGVKLQDQIRRLESSLALSDTPIKISLSSNQFTLVSLQKIGSKTVQLGQFSKKNLSLKPGRYVVKGERLGYQDVRTEIELYPATERTSFIVSCDKKVGSFSGNSGAGGI